MGKVSDYMKKVKTKKKITTAVYIVVGALVVTIIMAFSGLATMNTKMNYFYDGPYKNDTLQLEIRRDLQTASKYLLWAINTEDEGLTAERVAQAQEASEEVHEHIELLEEKFEDKALMGEVVTALENLHGIQKRLVEIAAANQNEEALLLYDTEYAPAASALEELLANVGELAEEHAIDTWKSSVIVATIDFCILILITILGIISSIKLPKAVISSIVTPVEELTEVAEQISKGNLNVDVQYESTDEFGELADAFRKTCQTLQLIIGDLTKVLGEMKEGNFQIESGCEEAYVGAFTAVLTNFKEMLSKQNYVLQQIQNSSEQVNLGATQMAENAQSLAEGATEQAGAVEELTATIENVTSATKNAADSASSAYLEAGEYLKQAAQGNQEMENLKQAMVKIDETSRKIESIIGEIEEIASQTNLLSLNASIEAARAGEAGKGFAVVADQIGKLASDSANSAVSTRELILECLSDVENGNAATERTRQVITGVIEGIEKLANVSKSTSEGANAQAELMVEVEKGIEQISSVVQSNSAAAQETSATSEELSAQSATLHDLIKEFRLRTE